MGCVGSGGQERPAVYCWDFLPEIRRRLAHRKKPSGCTNNFDKEDMTLLYNETVVKNFFTTELFFYSVCNRVAM
jgi:hypothetical protein